MFRHWIIINCVHVHVGLSDTLIHSCYTSYNVFVITYITIISNKIVSKAFNIVLRLSTEFSGNAKCKPPQSLRKSSNHLFSKWATVVFNRCLKWLTLLVITSMDWRFLYIYTSDYSLSNYYSALDMMMFGILIELLETTLYRP